MNTFTISKLDGKGNPVADQFPPTGTTMLSRPSRTDCEETIRMLCEHYPACFFKEPRQRRPLRKNIAADIIKDDDFAVAPEMIIAAVKWYKSHIGYAYALVAGTKRVDLDGREVGTVTQQEALAAKQRIGEIHERMAATNPVKTFSKMYSDGQISDCALKKLDAPPLSLKAALRAPESAALSLDQPSPTSAQEAGTTNAHGATRTKEEVLSSIRAQKKSRYQQQKLTGGQSGKYKKATVAILDGMKDDPDRIHTKAEIEVFAELAGINYRYVSPALTFMVAQGLINRVVWGCYRLPSSQ